MNEEQSERIRLLAEIATELLSMWREAEKTCVYEVSGHIESSLEGLERDAAWYRRQIQEAQHGRLAITAGRV